MLIHVIEGKRNIDKIANELLSWNLIGTFLSIQTLFVKAMIDLYILVLKEPISIQTLFVKAMVDLYISIQTLFVKAMVDLYMLVLKESISIQTLFVKAMIDLYVLVLKELISTEGSWQVGKKYYL